MPGWMNTGYLVTVLERTEFGLDYCFVAFFLQRRYLLLQVIFSDAFFRVTGNFSHLKMRY